MLLTYSLQLVSAHCLDVQSVNPNPKNLIRNYLRDRKWAGHLDFHNVLAAIIEHVPNPHYVIRSVELIDPEVPCIVVQLSLGLGWKPLREWNRSISFSDPRRLAIIQSLGQKRGEPCALVRLAGHPTLAVSALDADQTSAQVRYIDLVVVAGGDKYG
jgi:hypothetical protein